MEKKMGSAISKETVEDMEAAAAYEVFESD